ncbi:tryptophan dimethylallyltransferase family protein [Actinoplanes subtropicus]|uniref:tryptophan dimethylallyltransferase family protein n=1 Tax=Actinoplanes subtropicus TaxID=543632 RepID=UPI000A03A454|nr:tryptophan dimethylallyltransferase family protein [Actinoplanes subtropicus]
MNPATPAELLTDLLGPHGSRPLSKPPAWPSDVADDNSPVEFSVAWNRTEPPSLRILAEVVDAAPGVHANMAAAYDFLDRQTARHGLRTDRLDAVRDLFASASPDAVFALWCSLVFRSGRHPEFKVYFNPEAQGVSRSPSLVAEALGRLGLAASYRTMLDRAVRPGELGRLDRLSFFALDLHDGPQSRVKLYISHHDVHPRDAARAAAVVDEIHAAEVAEFCALAGRVGLFTARPLVSSYTLTEGVTRPTGYSVYVPIRSYVGDDREARERVLELMNCYELDHTLLDRAIDAVAQRPLDQGVGLIAHVALRLGRPRPGLTVYFSTEAYGVAAPTHLAA